MGIGQPTPAEIVQSLIESSEDLPDDAPCCAHCGGVSLDVLEDPISPDMLIKVGRGCPLSIAAYRAAVETGKGRAVALIDRGELSPLLEVDGEPIDPLEDYQINDCGCGSV